jgi:branched-chain amino acid transport system ATP-binding protein
MNGPALPLLDVRSLTMRFGGIAAIDDLSMQVEADCITSIIGPNGAGKTTLFNCLTGFYKPTSGTITLNDPARGPLSLERLPTHALARAARVVRTFQNIRLFPRMSVLENLIVAQHNELQRASRFAVAGLLGLRSYREAHASAVETALGLLERFDLAPFADTPAGALAYGLQRRVEIARAMSAKPRLLCLDEPAAGLNPRESAELKELLRSLVARNGVSVLLVEHDMTVVMAISHRVFVLNYGKKIAEGTPREVQGNPHVVAAYLGEPEADVQPATRIEEAAA